MRGRFSTIDPEVLRRLIEIEMKTQKQAATELGLCLSAIERACKRLGLKTQRTGPRSGPGHPNWQGGRYMLGQYWYVYCPDSPMATKAGYVAEHRLKMANSIGRPLRKEEVVHHMDGHPENNELENLQLFESNEQHLKHELSGRVPNWTPDGMKRIEAGVLKSSILRKSKPRAAKMQKT